MTNNNTLRLIQNGPIEAKGDIQVEGQDAVDTAYLCRCGLSQNKPYCDGSHSKNGFEASGECEVAEPKSLENSGGPLNISPRADGPCIISGNVDILSNDGATLDSRAKMALCRCGQSKNKPYCDGSHKEIEFKAEGA